VAVAVWEGVNLSSQAQKLIHEALSYYNRAHQIYITSATRSDPGSFHDWASQMAVDVGFGGRTPEGAELGHHFVVWIWPVRHLFAEIIFRDYRNGNQYGIKWGQPLNYGNSTYSAHENHVHLAMTEASARQFRDWAKKQAPKPPPAPPAPEKPKTLKPQVIGAVANGRF
jgi:hypothetical protein